MAYPTSSIIQWAKISQVLAFYDSAKKKSNVGYLDPDLHIKLWIEWQSLNWEYNQDSSSEYLFTMGNYVLSLCYIYLFEAMTVSGSGGASSTPSVPGSSYIYNEIKATVDGNAGSPVNGTYTYTNTDLIGGTDLSFILVNRVPEFSGDDFSFNPSTGTITRVNPWVTGDVVVIPYNQLV